MCNKTEHILLYKIECVKERIKRENKMKRWEYKIFRTHLYYGIDSFTETSTTELNNLGVGGWEMISSIDFKDKDDKYIIFKRELRN